MFAGHNAYLVVLSVGIAIAGGYTGFGLAARVRATPGAARRLLLAGAAGFVALGIWTMHFVGMLAAPIPPDAAYLVLPTILSFLICALVVGISLFFVSIGEASDLRVTAAALLMGAGIVTMHYVGIHGLSGPFRIVHQPAMVTMAALIAVGTAYGGLRIFLARHVGARLALSAVVFGLAVSGMHYTGMYGMRFAPDAPVTNEGLAASSEALSLIVALLCFLIVAGFLLFLVPESRGHPAQSSTEIHKEAHPPAISPSPLGGLGQIARAEFASRLPVEGADGTHLVDVADIRSIKADAHYTRIHDGSRERLCLWSISQVESQLDPAVFVRVHRSYIVAIPYVTLIRKEGDGAVVELDGETPHLVPVSRARIAEVKARLGLPRRGTGSDSI